MIRERLARWLWPTAFENEGRLYYLSGLVSELHRWCGEFPDIDAATSWINTRFIARYLSADGWAKERARDDYIGAPHLYADIPDFREWLRRRRDNAAPPVQSGASASEHRDEPQPTPSEGEKNDG